MTVSNMLSAHALWCAQQCSDAIKRAQVLKEKMGMSKSVMTPAAQLQQSATPQQLPEGTASFQQDEDLEQGLLARQGSLPNQQPTAGTVISKAISMPSGGSHLLRAYAAGVAQTGSPVEEVSAPSPNSPQRSILGEC